MRWADALNASPLKKAERDLKEPSDRSEPNVVLVDPKFNALDRHKATKAFRAPVDEIHGTTWSYGWSRVKLATADNWDDWRPA